MRFDPENYSEDTVSKVYRISDVLQQISFIPYLQKRLCFIGGSALNFIEFPAIERLSVDLDFNFRQQSMSKEWKKDRDKIDQYLKRILSDLNYNKSDIKINSSYALQRFDIKFQRNKSFKIEIGFVNRIPFFPKDRLLWFQHPRTDEECQILLPQREELFSSKCAALFSRKTPRDLFDTAIIRNLEFEPEILRKSIILQNMMSRKYNFPTMNIPEVLQSIRLDDSLRNVLKRVPSPTSELFAQRRTDANEFLTEMQSTLTKIENHSLNMFFQEQTYHPEFFGNLRQFNSEITRHPGLLWTLKKIQRNSPKK